MNTTAAAFTPHRAHRRPRRRPDTLALDPNQRRLRDELVRVCREERDVEDGSRTAAAVATPHAAALLNRHVYRWMPVLVPGAAAFLCLAIGVVLSQV